MLECIIVEKVEKLESHNKNRIKLHCIHKRLKVSSRNDFCDSCKWFTKNISLKEVNFGRDSIELETCHAGKPFLVGVRLIGSVIP